MKVSVMIIVEFHIMADLIQILRCLRFLGFIMSENLWGSSFDMKAGRKIQIVPQKILRLLQNHTGPNHTILKNFKKPNEI